MIIQGDVQISHVHNAALRKEISERLVISLGQKPVGMPPNLMVLMRQLRDETPKPVDPNPLKNFLASTRPTQVMEIARVDVTGQSGEAN